MSLYICVIDGEDDGEGMGLSSTDWVDYQRYVETRLTGEFPTLLSYDGWQGSWDANDAAVLEQELDEIERQLRRIRVGPVRRLAARKRAAGRGEAQGVNPVSMFEFFIDHNGTPITLMLQLMARECQATGATIRTT